MISFGEQTNLANSLGNTMGVMANTSPGTVVFRNNLYAFYTGNGGDGIFFTSWDGTIWSAPVLPASAPGLSVLPGTSPGLAVFNGILYLFFVGSGNDGIWYTTTNGAFWNPVQNAQSAPLPGQPPYSSPSAAVFNGALYLFYTDSAGNVYYLTSPDGENWTPALIPSPNQTPISVVKDTNCSAVVFGDTLYQFFNGGGGGGIFFTKTTDGTDWSPVLSVGAMMGVEMAAQQGTGPSATVFGSTLYLFWTDAAGDGLSYTSTSDGSTWASPSKMYPDDQIFEAFTSGSAIEYEDLLYVFWTGEVGDPGSLSVIYYAEGTEGSAVLENRHRS